MKENDQGACKEKTAAKAATARSYNPACLPLAGSCSLFVPPNYFNSGWYHLVPQTTQSRQQPR